MLRKNEIKNEELILSKGHKKVHDSNNLCIKIGSFIYPYKASCSRLQLFDHPIIMTVCD